MNGSGHAELAGATFAVLDVETTGLSPRHHHVIEVAVVRHQLGGAAAPQPWSTLVRAPFGRVGPTRIHGINRRLARTAPRFADVADAVMAQLDGVDAVVAHNAAFDWAFLSAELARCGRTPPALPVLCTYQLAKSVVPAPGPYGLAGLAERYAIAHGPLHTALADATVAAALFDHLVAEANVAGLSEVLASAAPRPLRSSRRFRSQRARFVARITALRRRRAHRPPPRVQR